MVSISEIEPEQGPLSGETRVLVRGGPFQKWEHLHPRPKVSYRFSRFWPIY